MSLPTELRRICGHDSRTVEGCVTCEAADRIEDLEHTAKVCRADAARAMEGDTYNAAKAALATILLTTSNALNQ